MDTNVLDLFDESDTILSIYKKFKKSKDKEKLQILKSLEAFKINNETYSHALAIIYKKENLKNINDFQNKQKVNFETNDNTNLLNGGESVDNDGTLKTSLGEKMVEFNFTEEERTRGCMYILIIFKNLNGIRFNDVKIVPLNNYPSKEIYDNLEDNWHFGILSYACLFRSFSEDSYVNELDSLLEINGIKKNQGESNLNHSFWKGNGFLIELIKMNNKSFILISNENVINSERIVASIRTAKNKDFKESYNNNEIAVNPNNIFFIKENMVLAKIFNVHLEDLKDIALPVKSNKEILIGTLNKSILPYSVEQLLNGISNIEFLYFRNLKGISYHDIKLPKAPSGNPNDFFSQDPDGDWYFTVMNFLMLFKAFSKDTFNIELDKLLTANNLEIENKVSENNRDYWIGENFNIEIPKMWELEMQNINIIIITNEKYTDSSALEIRETTLTNKTHSFKWIDGIKIFDYEDFSKNINSQLDLVNVPLYFKIKDQNEGSIIITVPTEVIGKSIIDKVINFNGGIESFRKTEEDNWSYLYRGYEFDIGYDIERSHIRINQLPSLAKSTLDHELQMRVQEFNKTLYMQKYDLFAEEVDVLYWYNIVLTRSTGLGGKELAKMQNKDTKQLMLEFIWGHANEYEVKHFNKDYEYKKRVCLMRILCFGYIYKCLFEFDIKLNELIEKNKFDDLEYKEDVLFRLIHAKASVYGTIKYALASNISEEEIKEWFPSFEFDQKLINGIDPMSSFY